MSSTQQLILGEGAGGAPAAYQIERSLRFNSADSAYLNRTFGSAPTNDDKATISLWVKRTNPGAENQLYSARASGANAYTSLRFDSTDELDFLMVNSSSTVIARLVTTAKYRDPSAWYHIVFAYDSTDATSSNRLKLYVNGVQVTVFNTATYPAQNTDLALWAKNTVVNYISREGDGYSNYLNGYLTEINFIDGQALTPSSFGQTNASTGVWEPIAYTGTYGTNGFYLNFSDNSSVNALGLDQSGNTSGSSDTAPVTLGVDGTGWTGYGIRQVIPASGLIWSGNKCRVKLTGGSSGLTVVGCAIGKQAASGNAWDFDGNQASVTFSGSSSVTISANTTVYSDWISFSISTANTYVVGMAVSNSGTNTVQRGTNTNFVAYDKIGGYTDATSTAPSGYSTAGSNTILFAGLELQANNWTPNNFSVTAGSGNDSLVDTPTSYGTDTGVGGEVRGNYATLNPLAVTYGTSFSNGNLKVLMNGANTSIPTSTIAVSSGKWYAEMLVESTNAGTRTYPLFGICNPRTFGDPAFLGDTADEYSYSCDGYKTNNNVATNVGTTLTTNDIMMLAFDADSGKIWWGKNGTWIASGDPATGANAMYSSIPSSTYVLALCGYTSTNATVNFGQRAFAYTAPSGFKALCTQNLPTPTIGATSTTQANKYFDIVLATGNANTPRSFTGLNFQPDIVWSKSRSSGYNNGIWDAVRGAGSGKVLITDKTDPEGGSVGNDTQDSKYGYISSFNSDGFTATKGTDALFAYLNANGATYVNWAWKANGAGSSNTAGTITSTVSANTTSGFSIVTYTGTGSNATVGHGLGVAPSMIIVKDRDSGAYSWAIYHISIGAANALDFTTASSSASATSWNSTAPTSTVFSIGTRQAVNVNTDKYVAYCFAPVAGYSAFGSYTGNGSADGPFVFTNHRPAFLLIKRTDSTSNWTILDFKRVGYNVDNDQLYPNLSNAEATTDLADLLSNGFKLRSTDTSVNASGGTYIYAAFAESPFKYSLAR